MKSLANHGRTILLWLPALLWMVVIFVLSSQSGLRVSDDAAVDKPLRVAAHLGSYALLAGLLLLALDRGARPTLRRVAVAFAVAALYGVSDEVHQSLVPDRTGRAEDVLVDALGAAIGVAVAALILASSPRLRRGDGSRNA